MKMSNSFFILEPGLRENLTKKAGDSKEGFALIVEEGQLGLKMFESEFLSNFNSFSDFFGDIELVVELCENIIFGDSGGFPEITFLFLSWLECQQVIELVRVWAPQWPE